MKIAIVGAGAMGSLFGGLLMEGGWCVSLLTRREEDAEEINRRGVRLEGLGGERTLPVPASAEPETVAGAELILMAVKAYDTAAAIRGIVDFVGSEAAVLTLQNGLGNVETIAAAVGLERTLGGVTAHGATRLGVGHVRHAGRGETVLGEVRGGLSPRATQLAERFTQAGIETRATADVAAALWGKLLVNVGINALGAITGWPNGRLAEAEATRAIMAAAVTEAVQVARARGLSFEPEAAIAKVEEVCRATAQNLNSMLQDLQRGRRTEIDAINGAIAAESTRLGVPTPVNWTLTQLVRALEGNTPCSAQVS